MNKYKIIDRLAYQFDIQHRLERANNRVIGKNLTKLTSDEMKKFDEIWGGVEINKLQFLQGLRL